MINVSVSLNGIVVSDSGNLILSYNFNGDAAIAVSFPKEKLSIGLGLTDEVPRLEYQPETNIVRQRAKHQRLVTGVAFRKVYDEVILDGGTFKSLQRRFPRSSVGALRAHMRAYKIDNGGTLPALKPARRRHRK